MGTARHDGVTRRSRGARALAGRLLLAAGSFVLAVAVTELVLRAGGWMAPSDAVVLKLPGATEAVEPFTRHDELLMYAVIPGARTYDWYSIDAHGYRTPAFSDRKPPGSFRVIVTGDSSTFGLSVLEEQRWSSVLRRALSGLCEGARAVEVVNAGITGYSTFQNRMQVERDLAPLQPDLLAWLVTGVNDSTRVEGPGDAEQSAHQRSWLRRLARLHVARLLGLDHYGWRGMSPNAEDGSTTAQPRVSVDDGEANLRAVEALLPGRLLIGIFPPQPGFREQPAIAALAARAEGLAAERDVAVADLRPTIASLYPFPLYLDSVHPNPLGHTLIARAVLAATLPRIEVPPARAAWIEAWRRGQQGELRTQAGTLAGPGAPARFSELVALCDAAAELDTRLLQDDPTLPAAVLDWDPLLGRRCRERSSARLLAAGGDHERRAEIERWVHPRDPLLACFADDTDFLAASDEERGLARALVAFTAELGLIPIRADERRGQATVAATPAEAVELLQAVLALAPSDAEARYELALALRRAGRSDEARVEWATLSAGSGPLADFARGTLAFGDERFAEAETDLKQAVRDQPSLGYARTLLGKIFLSQDRLDEATREFALAAGLIGAKDELPALMAQIAARRRELGR